MRFILSAYAGPIPRPVVPIFDFPKNLSETLSIVRWYGVIKCALVEILSFEVLTAKELQSMR